MSQYENVQKIINELHRYIQLQEKSKEKNEALINLYKTKIFLDDNEEKLCEKHNPPPIENEKILLEVRRNENIVEFYFYSNTGKSKTLWYELSTEKLMNILSNQKDLNN